MCLISAVDYRSILTVLAILAGFALLGGCSWPVFDPEKLKAIKAEAVSLTASHPIKPPKAWVDVPKSQWPRAIASLQPHSVTIRHWGADIVTKSDMDGGWGYHIAQNKQDLPMPAGCYSEPIEGVFWHAPC